LIPEVEETVARAAEWATGPDARKRLGVLHGPATAGKTLALRRLGERLSSQGFRVFRLSPAGGQVDTCAQILAELGDHAELAEVARDPAVLPAQRAREIHHRLGALGGGRVALLFDEPRLDESPSADPDPLMARALVGERAMARELTQADGVVRFVAAVTPPEDDDIEKFALTTRAPSDWLSKAEIWGPLEPHASALARQFHGEELLRSALHLRLAVTLLALGDSADGVKSTLRVGSEWVTTGLARRVWERASEPLRQTWAALAVMRRGLSTLQLEQLTKALPEDQHELVNRGLLYQVGTDWRMHETVRAVALEHQDSVALLNEHVSAASRYSAEIAGTLVSKVEAFHHWLSGGRPDQARHIPPLDIDQMNLLGRFLSRQHLFDEAIEVFKSVLQSRADDDYAHHYFAYNLDRLGRDPKKVEHHYRTAIERAPDNVWWHSRYVCFLITTGRDREARFAWTEALSATQSRANPPDAWYYENLHQRIVDLLLRRGQTDWAGSVLRSIPEQVFDRSADLRRLRDRQRVLIEVGRNGAVFPVWIEHSAWWSGPHLLPRHARKPGASKKEIPLESWWAVRVEALSGGDVYLLYAERADLDARYGRTTVRKRTVEGWLGDVAGEELEPGRFLEIGFYGPAGKLVRARAHPRTSPVRLDDREEDTARYLRAPLEH
jgi:tetratricopeptide (TPR) repeat protein